MENLINEQIENTTQTAEAENILGEQDNKISLTKFKDVESLQKAYNSLESEFTKRSQRLKRLEEEKLFLEQSLKQSQDLSENKDGFDGDWEEFFEIFPDAKQVEQQLTEKVNSCIDNKHGKKELLARAYIEKLSDDLKNLNSKFCDEDFLLNHIQSTRIKDSIIRDYLQNVNTSKPKTVLLEDDGGVYIAPPKKPKTLAEAGELAKGFLNFK